MIGQENLNRCPILREIKNFKQKQVVQPVQDEETEYLEEDSENEAKTDRPKKREADRGSGEEG